MSNRSFGVGSYTRHVATTVDPFNQRVMAFKNDDASGLEDTPENWSAEKVKAAAEMFAREDQKQQNKIASAMADVFIAQHPEYRDTAENGRMMTHELRRSFGEGEYTFEHYERAYQSLRASNFLEVDQKIVREQRKEAARARAEQERARIAARTFDEDSAYGSLSMDELRRKADEQLRHDMQRRAEEGGW